MKITLMAALLVVVLGSGLFAQETVAASTDAQRTLEKRIRAGRIFALNDVLDMQKESIQLMKEDKVKLYDRYSINGGMLTGALLMNIVVPGSGSLLIGDMVGGLCLMVPAITAVALFTAGVITGYYGFTIAGALVYIAMEPLGWIIPFTYAGSWNKNLRTGLGVLTGEYGGKQVNASGSFYRQTGVLNGNIELPLLSYRF